MIEGGGYSFSPSEGTIDLGPYESATLSFPYNQGSNDLELSRVSLTVWPTGHEYAPVQSARTWGWAARTATMCHSRSVRVGRLNT